MRSGGRTLSLSGAGLSLMADGQLRGTAGVSEPGIEAMQKLQLTLGEGPCVDAWRDREPVWEEDLAYPAQVRWPAFAEAGVLAGVHTRAGTCAIIRFIRVSGTEAIER